MVVGKNNGVHFYFLFVFLKVTRQHGLPFLGMPVMSTHQIFPN